MIFRIKQKLSTLPPTPHPSTNNPRMPRPRVRKVEKRKRVKVKIEPGVSAGAGTGVGSASASGSGSASSEPPAKRRRVVATTEIKREVKKEKGKGKGKGKEKVKREVKREEQDEDEEDELMFDCAMRRRERKGKEGREALVGPKKKGSRGSWDGVSRWKHYSLCLAYAQSLNLKSQRDWEAWCKLGQRPEDVPSQPEKIYAGIGWSGWGSFLGTGNLKYNKKNFRSFDACRTYARSLELTSKEAWHAWCKVPGNRPADVPSGPYREYKDAGWTNWGDFLGTGKKRRGWPKKK